MCGNPAVYAVKVRLPSRSVRTYFLCADCLDRYEANGVLPEPKKAAAPKRVPVPRKPAAKKAAPKKKATKAKAGK